MDIHSLYHFLGLSEEERRGFFTKYNLEYKDLNSLYYLNIKDKLEIKNYIRDTQKQILDNSKELIDHVKDVLMAVNGTIDKHNEILQEHNKIIKSTDDELKNDLENLFNNIKHKDLLDEILQEHFENKNQYSDELINEIGLKFARFCNAQYPGLFLGLEHRFLNYMVASDPLFVVYFNEKFKENILKIFNIEYYKKIRFYKQKSLFELTELPTNQFSSVVIWDIVPYLNLFNTARLVRNYWAMLRPGGVLIFNFNNCFKLCNFLAADQNLKSFHTVENLVHICNEHSKDFTHIEISDTIDFAILKKEGTLSTIKVQPVTNKIFLKSA